MVIFVFLCCSLSILYADQTQEKSKADEPSQITKLDINTASETELIKLPGIGEKLAKAIIEYRAQKPFTKEKEIIKVKGIGGKTYEKIKNLIEVKEVKR